MLQWTAPSDDEWSRFNALQASTPMSRAYYLVEDNGVFDAIIDKSNDPNHLLRLLESSPKKTDSVLIIFDKNRKRCHKASNIQTNGHKPRRRAKRRPGSRTFANIGR